MITVSFFSYKGGAGRSSLAYNVVPLLAEELQATPEQPIVVVDLDVDSAGMTYLLEANEMNLTNKIKMQDIIKQIPGEFKTPDELPLVAHPFFSNLISVGNKFGLYGPNANDKIRFLPVDIKGDKTRFDQGGNNILNSIRRLCTTYNCKALIFDTPAGNQLTAAWALRASKDIVTTMRITHQFTTGTIDYLKLRDVETTGKRYIIVPNAIPQEPILIDGLPYSLENVRLGIINRIKEEIKTSNNQFDLTMLEKDENGIYGIPEVKRFKIRESLLYKIPAEVRTTDESLALKQYHKLVKVICGN